VMARQVARIPHALAVVTPGADSSQKNTSVLNLQN